MKDILVHAHVDQVIMETYVTTRAPQTVLIVNALLQMEHVKNVFQEVMEIVVKTRA